MGPSTASSSRLQLRSADDVRLQLPSPGDSHHAKARQLRGNLPTTPVLAGPAPPRGYFRTILDLTNEDAGVPPEIFWDLFSLCHGCNRIMSADLLGFHTCNLTV